MRASIGAVACSNDPKQDKRRDTQAEDASLGKASLPALDDYQRRIKGETLCLAADSGDFFTASKALREGADPDFRQHMGSTGLVRAASRGHERIARLLLASNADPNFHPTGSTPLRVAAEMDEVGVLLLLLSDPRTDEHVRAGFPCLSARQAVGNDPHSASKHVLSHRPTRARALSLFSCLEPLLACLEEAADQTIAATRADWTHSAALAASTPGDHPAKKSSPRKGPRGPRVSFFVRTRGLFRAELACFVAEALALAGATGVYVEPLRYYANAVSFRDYGRRESRVWFSAPRGGLDPSPLSALVDATLEAEGTGQGLGALLLRGRDLAQGFAETVVYPYPFRGELVAVTRDARLIRAARGRSSGVAVSPPAFTAKLGWDGRAAAPRTLSGMKLGPWLDSPELQKALRKDTHGRNC